VPHRRRGVDELFEYDPRRVGLALPIQETRELEEPARAAEPGPPVSVTIGFCGVSELAFGLEHPAVHQALPPLSAPDTLGHHCLVLPQESSCLVELARARVNCCKRKVRPVEP
jgi:hypothetical protein